MDHPRPSRPLLEWPQPCPLCQTPIRKTHAIEGPPLRTTGGTWQVRVRLYCEFCDGVILLMLESQISPWRQRTVRFHDGRSRELRQMVRDLAARAESGIRTQ